MFAYMQHIVLFNISITRIIYIMPFDYPTFDLFHDSKIWTADKMYHFKSLIRAHKLYHSQTFQKPSHYNTWFQSSSLPTPFYSSSAGQRTSNFVMSALWNKLTASLKLIKPIGEFKTEIRFHLSSAWWALVPTPYVVDLGLRPV